MVGFLLLVAIVAAALGLYSFENLGTVTTVHLASWSWVGVPVWYTAVAAAVAMLLASVAYMVPAGLRWRLRHRSLRIRQATHGSAIDHHGMELEELRDEVERLSKELAALKGPLENREALQSGWR